MNTPGEVLTSPYVQLGVAKAVLLIALGGLGALQRRQIATGFDESAAAGAPAAAAVGTYRQLALLELVLLGLAVALAARSEEHTSELQSRGQLVCRLLLAKKKQILRRDAARNP